MSAVFLKIVNMSITASWLILAVVLVRLLLKKAPKWIRCLLWGLVAIRLVCPFSFGSVFSLIPSSETIPANITVQQEPAINSGITVVNEFINPVIAESFTPAPTDSVNPLQIIIPVAASVWIFGIVIMLAYALISCSKLKKTVSVCVPVGERIFACDEVKAPFILGVFRPVIYVPSSLNGETLDLVIRHESAHLQRRDHWWKPLGFLLLSVYWFNPLCWIAYILLCRDIEMACDEKVIRDMDKDDMAAYSQALLDCSFPRKRIAACPLAFGEVGVKERVKGVLNYKKPAFWIILIAIIACIVLAVCLMTDPFSNRSLSGKLGVSMDMAVAEHNRSPYSEGRFIATDYDVLLVSESGNETTVYAWVLYEEYSFDGRDVKVETGSHIPTAITFDTSNNGNDSAAYDVIEYWEPRDGSYFANDIRAKFPWTIRGKALDITESKAKPENCLKVAREYFGVDESNLFDTVFGRYYTIQEIRYEGKRDGGNSGIPLPEYCLSSDKKLMILEDLNSNNWLNAGTFTEVVLSKDNFDQYFDPDGKTLAANMRRNNAKAWQVIVSALPDSLFYYLLLQKDGEVCLTRGYYDASEKGYADSDDTRISYVFLLKEKDTGADHSLPYSIEGGIKTTVAYANWTEGGMMRDCLNGDKMIISSVRHLPVYKFDTLEELNRFKESYKDILTFDQGYDEVPSFKEVTAAYGESFFADHTVVLAYVEASSGSFRYAVRDISCQGAALCLDVEQTNHPEVYTDDMSGWFVIAEVLDSDIAAFTEYDAQLLRDND